MALEFTNIPDRTGPAVYLIGDGSHAQEQTLKRLGEDIDKLTPEDTHVVCLSAQSGDGLRVKEFYALSSFPTAMIIMDDDTIYQLWSVQLPPPDQITYHLSHVSGSMR